MARRLALYDPSGIRRVFSQRNYAIYATGNSISLIGLWVQRLAVGWLAWDLTHSGLWLGAAAFADLFPVVLIGLFGGVLADRHDRRVILLAGQSLAFLQAVTLWLLTAFGFIGIGTLFSLSLFLGVVVAVLQPSRLSLVPGLVRDEDLGAAVAIGAVLFNIARLIGPALAGILIHTVGVALAFAFNALTFLALIVALGLLHLPPQTTRVRERSSVLREVAGGVAYAARHPGIAPVLLLLASASLLSRPAFELLPGFADAIFHAGPGGLAVLTSAVAAGALAGGLWLAQRASAQGFTAAAIFSAAASGAAVAAFALTGWMWAAAALAASGFSVAVLGISTQTLIQTGVDGAMRGRVLSIWGLILRGAPALGVLAMGWASDYIGLGPPLVLGGALCIAAAALLARRREHIMALLEAPPARPAS